MHCKINTRSAMVAATSAVDSVPYNPRASLSENTGMSTPLLSRFDLVFVMRDVKNEYWDRKIAQHLLYEQCVPVADGGDEAGRSDDDPMDDHDGSCTETILQWTFEELKMYFRVIKSLRPKLSEGAQKILSNYYYSLRQNDVERKEYATRITVRVLEGLIR